MSHTANWRTGSIAYMLRDHVLEWPCLFSEEKTTLTFWAFVFFSSQTAKKQENVGEGSVSWATGLVEPPMFPGKLQQRQLHGTTQWLDMLLENDWHVLGYVCHNGQNMWAKSMFLFDGFRIVINVCWCVNYQHVSPDVVVCAVTNNYAHRRILVTSLRALLRNWLNKLNYRNGVGGAIHDPKEGKLSRG